MIAMAERMGNKGARQHVISQDQLARRYGRKVIEVMVALLFLWWFALFLIAVILQWVSAGGIDSVRSKAGSPVEIASDQ